MKFRFFLRFAAVFSAFGAAALGAKYQKLKEQKLSLPHGFTVTAHTGCDGSPDNSIESIQRAIFSDVPVIENDLTLRTTERRSLCTPNRQETAACSLQRRSIT